MSDARIAIQEARDASIELAKARRDLTEAKRVLALAERSFKRHAIAAWDTEAQGKRTEAALDRMWDEHKLDAPEYLAIANVEYRVHMAEAEEVYRDRLADLGLIEANTPADDESGDY